MAMARNSTKSNQVWWTRPKKKKGAHQKQHKDAKKKKGAHQKQVTKKTTTKAWPQTPPVADKELPPWRWPQTPPVAEDVEQRERAAAEQRKTAAGAKAALEDAYWENWENWGSAWQLCLHAFNMGVAWSFWNHSENQGVSPLESQMQWLRNTVEGSPAQEVHPTCVHGSATQASATSAEMQEPVADAINPAQLRAICRPGGWYYGDNNMTLKIQTITGTYVEHGTHHGRKCYKRTASDWPKAFLYYFDGRLGASNQGWWFGNQIDGDHVFAFNPDGGESGNPPTAGWKMPCDGDVHPYLSVLVGGNPDVQAEFLKLPPRPPPPYWLRDEWHMLVFE